MAIGDRAGEPIITGSWLYGGAVWTRIDIVACNFDRDHAHYIEEMEHVREEHGYELPPPSPPRPLGPDGVFYHVGSSPDFDTVAEAKAWADAQPWGPVTWDT